MNDKTNSADRRESFHNPLTKPTVVKAALAAFLAGITAAGCGPAASSPQPEYCLEDPTEEYLRTLSEEQLRRCLEEADRQNHRSYSGYYGYYIGRGYPMYTRGSYSSYESRRPVFSTPTSGSSGTGYSSGGSSYYGKGGSSPSTGATG